ncbi:DUF995 domain-containing protein [Mesorhizobium sp. RCC_202]|uniref:DUF995 domain-containing protein n=1 Tax=Mesorhizobium sp. RCC_202 TaxID=3239222 RepID=UPI0035262B07
MAILLALCAPLALSGVANAATAKAGAPAKANAARVPTAYELSLLYADRTWIWKDGAAYFGQNGRALRAWTSGTDSAFVAEGKWIVTGNGKMCMDLAWRGKSYSGKEQRSCYSHRINGRNIEQRKDPDGEWYSFKQSPLGSSDEYRNFQPGDTKGAQLEETRKLVESKN